MKLENNFETDNKMDELKSTNNLKSTKAKKTMNKSKNNL